MEKKIITSHQLYTFSALSMLGGSILVVSSTMATVAKHDAWISALLTTAFGALMVWIYGFISSRYKGLTLIGITKKILGKFVGGIVAAWFVFTFFNMSYAVPWWIGTFGAHAMPETPVPVILLLYVAAVILSVIYDIETIARAAEFLYPFVTILFAVAIVFVLPNSHIVYLTPVLENGITPILKGAFLLSAFIVFPGVAILTIFPVNTDDVLNGRKAMVKGFLWCGSVTFVTTITSTIVLGSGIIAKSSFPTILLAREINVGIVLTRLEYVISIMWTVTEFMIGLMFFYVFLKSLSELLGLKDHKKIAFPVGLIVLMNSWLIYPSSQENMNNVMTAFVPNATLCGIVLPIIMLTVYLIKKHVFNKT